MSSKKPKVTRKRMISCFAQIVQEHIPGWKIEEIAPVTFCAFHQPFVKLPFADVPVLHVELQTRHSAFERKLLPRDVYWLLLGEDLVDVMRSGKSAASSVLAEDYHARSDDAIVAICFPCSFFLKASWAQGYRRVCGEAKCAPVRRLAVYREALKRDVLERTHFAAGPNDPTAKQKAPPARSWKG